MSIEIPSVLLDEVSRGRASLFLGAGASREAHFPSADELGNYLASKAGPDHAKRLSGQALDFIVQDLYFQKGYGEGWVKREVIEYLEQKHREVNRPPSKAHDLMTKIRWRTIFTTNYDRLIEIAYDSSNDCVQRCLPIYETDPQILRHESHVVRLIKLNGSVDEAARNSSHQLVFTFVEQQNARSRNKEFYDLLREESVNGPIIFIGFRFAHPGANMAGTSPEFQVLLDLLRDMGPSARWHYCVTPLGQLTGSDELAMKVLQSSKIDVIDAKFEEFTESLFERITTPIPLAKRKSITVFISNQTLSIDADEYEKDKRHFEILGPHIEEGPVPTVRESLNGGETWGSFIHRHLIERSCKNHLIEIINNASQNAPEICIFGASAGWGKTFLLRDIAIDFYQSQRPVIWLNPYGTLEMYVEGKKPIVVGRWDAIRIDSLIRSINDIKERHNLKAEYAVPLIIADNCPERSEEVLSLFRYLSHQGRKFVIIFSVRDYDYEKLLEEEPLVKKKARYSTPEKHFDQQDDVRNLIDFCINHGVTDSMGDLQKESVTSRIISENADVSLILALQVIFDKNHRPFSEIIKDLWENNLSEKEQEIIFRISSLHRLGINFSPRLYTLVQTFPANYRAEIFKLCFELEKRHILFEEDIENEPCIATRHSLFAEQFIRLSGKGFNEIDGITIMLIQNMSHNLHDLEIIRRILKRITDYDFSLSSEEINEKLFKTSAKTTSNDWVVCQQYSKYLGQRGEYEAAYYWIERALEDNPNHASLHHSKGNILRHWGIDLLKKNDLVKANQKLEDARKWFAMSRTKPDPDEYGYVSHLEMIIYLMRNSGNNQLEYDRYLAEGVQLYENGIHTLAQDRFNLLLEERFTGEFDIGGKATDELCKRIIKALGQKQTTDLMVCFLAQELYKKGYYDESIKAIEAQRKISEGGVLLWVKEAELHAREGHFDRASKSIDTARRNLKQVENSEVQWSLLYWDLIIAVASESFVRAREASHNLTESGHYSGHFFPRGYFWKKSAKSVLPTDRILKEHAKIWSGRIENIRGGGRYGQIAMRNAVGDIFYIEFNPTYFRRKDLRRGDNINFAITILPKGLRADDIDSKPFLNTSDDIFV